MRKTNKAGLNLIKSFEGLKLTSYLCPAKVWTIGYGSTGKDIGPNMVWTEQQAEARMRQDLTKFELDVERMVTVNINENQFSALVSFAYNIGSGALEKSTLLRSLNTGDVSGAADQFLRWNKAGGKELAGLTSRRQAERALFLTPADEYNLPEIPTKEEVELKLFEIELEALK